MKDHVAKWLVIVALLPLCWLAMMAVHEAGHVLGAWLSGGVVSGVVLHPFAISRTDLTHNPHPLFVTWAGPVVGSVVPPLAYLVLRAIPLASRHKVSPPRSLPGTHVMRFFAGFCLIANGAYLGIGSFGRVGDVGELLKYGTPLWVLWAFGAITMPAGLWLWHNLGAEFGLGPAGRAIRPWEAIILWTLLAVVVATMLLFA
jgi:hypothetical protein